MYFHQIFHHHLRGERKLFVSPTPAACKALEQTATDRTMREMQLSITKVVC